MIRSSGLLTNTAAIAAALKPHVARVVVANPLQVRLIAESRVKTDKIDAAILAQLYASGFLPQVWSPMSVPKLCAGENDALGNQTKRSREICSTKIQRIQ